MLDVLRELTTALQQYDFDPALQALARATLAKAEKLKLRDYPLLAHNPETGQTQILSCDRCANVPELLAQLRLALQYLEHPDVLTLTRKMALSGDAVVERCKDALTKAKG